MILSSRVWTKKIPASQVSYIVVNTWSIFIEGKQYLEYTTCITADKSRIATLTTYLGHECLQPWWLADAHGNSDELEGNLKAHSVQSCSKWLLVQMDNSRTRPSRWIEAGNRWALGTQEGVFPTYIGSVSTRPPKRWSAKLKEYQKFHRNFHISCVNNSKVLASISSY